MSTKLPPGYGQDLTIAGVAAIRGVHPDTVRRAIARGELPAYRVGRQIRIRPADLDRWGRRIAVAP